MGAYILLRYICSEMKIVASSGEGKILYQLATGLDVHIL